MVELQTIDKPDLKWKRLNHQQLYDAEITFVFNKEDDEGLILFFVDLIFLFMYNFLQGDEFI